MLYLTKLGDNIIKCEIDYPFLPSKVLEHRMLQYDFWASSEFKDVSGGNFAIVSAKSLYGQLITIKSYNGMCSVIYTLDVSQGLLLKQDPESGNYIIVGEIAGNPYEQVWSPTKNILNLDDLI